MNEYIGIAVSFVLAAGIAGLMVFLGSTLGKKNPTAVKLSPFECGKDPFSLPIGRLAIKFYLTAILFIPFDVELVFLYPWAVLYRQLGINGNLFPFHLFRQSHLSTPRFKFGTESINVYCADNTGDFRSGIIVSPSLRLLCHIWTTSDAARCTASTLEGIEAPHTQMPMITPETALIRPTESSGGTSR